MRNDLGLFFINFKEFKKNDRSEKIIETQSCQLYSFFQSIVHQKFSMKLLSFVNLKLFYFLNSGNSGKNFRVGNLNNLFRIFLKV